MAEEKRESIGVRNAPTYSKNPFMGGSLASIRGKKKHYDVSSSVIGVDRGTGEHLPGVEHKVVHMVDDTKFVKVFADGISGIYDLGAAGSKVFRFLFDTVQKHPNVDRIYLYFMNAMEEPWAIPKSTFFRGMAELLEKNFIARSSDPNMFYLNPAMIWNGDRFKFVHEYVRAQQIEGSDAADRRVLEAKGQQRLIE